MCRFRGHRRNRFLHPPHRSAPESRCKFHPSRPRPSSPSYWWYTRPIHVVGHTHTERALCILALTRFGGFACKSLVCNGVNTSALHPGVTGIRGAGVSVITALLRPWLAGPIGTDIIFCALASVFTSRFIERCETANGRVAGVVRTGVSIIADLWVETRANPPVHLSVVVQTSPSSQRSVSSCT